MQSFVSAGVRSESDEALLRRVAQRDIEAYETFYDRHAQTVYGLLLRIINDVGIAEELTQEVFWQVWQKADQYIGTGAPAAWLLRVTRNRAFDQLRRQRARPMSLNEDFSAFEHVSELVARDVETHAEKNWQQQQIRQVLANIPEEQRVCLELAYFDGLSQRDIAEKTKTPLGTIKTRMNMGMQKLERMLRAIGYP